MSNNDPKSLSELVSTDQSALGRLAAEARARLGLTDHIRAGLPADLAGQMTSCNLGPEGILTVRTTGPEWAARLRFETERILTLCRQRHPETRSVKVGVAHPDAT
jgi:hypothetical protein